MIKLRQTLDDLVVEIEAENPRQAIAEMAFWSGLPSQCPMCDAPLRFFYRDPSGNKYYGQRCTGKVPHEANLGIFKEGQGLFYKGDRAFETAYGFSDED